MSQAPARYGMTNGSMNACMYPHAIAAGADGDATTAAPPFLAAPGTASTCSVGCGGVEGWKASSIDTTH